MALEATSWIWLREGVRRTLPAFSLMERVENGVMAGMADVNYIVRGIEGWIELKAVNLPVRDSTPVLGPKEGLNVDQINWHLARTHQCGRTWVFVSADPYRWLVSGAYALEINKWTRDDFCLKATMWYDEKWSPKEWTKLIHFLSWRVGG